MKWILGIVVAIVVIVAAIFALIFHRLLPQVSYSLDFGSIVDALVLLLVGVLIEFAYLKQSSEKRADTDLLLRIVDEAKAAFADLQKTAETCESGRALTKKEQISLTCAEREVSNAIHSLEMGLGHCKIRTDGMQFEKLKDTRANLKDALTDTPFPGPYDPASLVRIRIASKDMRDELTRIAFAINHR